MWQRVRAVLGGAAAAWLAVLFLLVLLAVRPDGEETSLRGVAEAVAALGWLPGVAIALLAPVAAAPMACALVGAAAGVAVDAAFYGPHPRTAAWAAGLMAVSSRPPPGPSGPSADQP